MSIPATTTVAAVALAAMAAFAAPAAEAAPSRPAAHAAPHDQGSVSVGDAAGANGAAPRCPSGFEIRGSCVPVGVSPLAHYVHSVPDDKYGWTGPHQTFPAGPNGAGVGCHVLNLTSQGWLTAADFKPGSPAHEVWTHHLVVCLPRAVTSPHAFLWVTGGDNPAPGAPPTPVSETDSEVAVAANLAAATGTVGVVLKQVPNQPVRFAVDIPHPTILYPNETREEDGIIAYTWNRFIFQDPEHSAIEWALRLPMTKSVSRAMDAVAEFVGKERPDAGKIGRFVVGGESKRGWTTWTTGLVEERCVAIVPVVMDFLSVANLSVHHYRSLGGWTFEFADYVAAGVVDSAVLHEAPYNKLMRVVDPKSYFAQPAAWADTPALRNFRAIPKLVVDGGNDEFMLPDDNHAWWDALPGEKHLLHIANADHPLRWWPPGSGTGRAVFDASLAAFYGSVVKGEDRPDFTWEVLPDGLTIVAKGFSAAPVNATMWAAVTADGFRDWRLFNCRTAEPGHNCTHYETDPSPDPAPGSPAPHPVPYRPTALRAGPDGTFTGECPKPPEGQWVACFLDFSFKGGFRFTTQMTIYPMALPFGECSGANCSRMV